MVLSERVAWPEYMDMVRAALTKQAEAIIKQGAALEAGSSGGWGGAAGGQATEEAAAAATAAASNASAGNEPNAPTPPPPPDRQASESAPAGVRQLTLGKTLRGTTAAGAESWALFRFDLPTAGPIVTVVLDIADGDPDIVVSKGKLPSTGFGPKESAAAAVKTTVSTPAPPPPIGGVGGERKHSAAAVAGVPALPGGVGGGGGEWQASSTHRGLRVVKIFPRDPG